MRKTLILICGMIAATALLAGCGAKKNDEAAATASDSLLASNPQEPAAGNITPQMPAQTPEPAPAQTQAPAPKPKPVAPKSSSPRPAPVNRGVTVPGGTPVKVTMDANITSETAQ